MSTHGRGMSDGDQSLPSEPARGDRRERLWVRWPVTYTAVLGAALTVNQVLGLFNWMLLTGLGLLIGSVLILITLPRRSRRRHTLTVAFAVVILTVGVAIGVWGGWDKYRGPHLNRETSLALCSQDIAPCRAELTKLKRGTSVTQVCWEQGFWLGSSRRYFYLEAGHQGGYGFPISVSNQQGSPPCQTVAWMRVANSFLRNTKLHLSVNSSGKLVRPAPGPEFWSLLMQQWTQALGQTPRCFAASAAATLACYQKNRLIKASPLSEIKRGDLIFARCGNASIELLALGDSWAALLASPSSNLVATRLANVECAMIGAVPRAVIESTS
ncbi:MAG: hypothetical protein ACJ74U_13775 [Jatrophihabitantaceae bacterium]